MTTRKINQGTVAVVRVPPQARPKADVGDVAMRVNQFSGRRTALSSPLSQFLVLLMYPMLRREPRCGRVSAFVRHQAVRVFSCFREGRNHLG
jgi:hypothetical protein